MDSVQYIQLDDIIALIGDPTDVCIDICNTTITSATPNPMHEIVRHYHIYKGLLKAKRIYSMNLPGFKKTDYKAVTFQTFYRMLDRSIRDIIFSKQPGEVYCVFQNE